MGQEILTTGQVQVLRPDAEELLQIRDGKWSYDELLEYAEDMDNDIRNKNYKGTDLRAKVDLNEASTILYNTQERIWDEQ
jgi:hypothetical protein